MTTMHLPRELTSEKQVTFVDLVCRGLSLRAASKQVGWAPNAGSVMAAKPAIKSAIQARLAHRLQTVHAPIAVEILAKMMKSPEELSANRIKCAQLLMDRAGLVPPKAAEPEAPNQKDAAEMTTREIEEFVAKAQAQLAQRQAQTIDITPQEPDILD